LVLTLAFADAAIAGSAMVKANDVRIAPDIAVAALDGLPPKIAEAAAHTESGFNPHVIGAAGEIGVTQILPSTASAGSGFGCGAGFAWRASSGLDEKSPAVRL
jgi:soluble lytic murein transglycosylase-like protein